jgi:hypothetical protein
MPLAQRHIDTHGCGERELPTLGFARKNNHLGRSASSGSPGGVPLQYRAFAAGHASVRGATLFFHSKD